MNCVGKKVLDTKWESTCNGEKSWKCVRKKITGCGNKNWNWKGRIISLEANFDLKYVQWNVSESVSEVWAKVHVKVGVEARVERKWSLSELWVYVKRKWSVSKV